MTMRTAADPPPRDAIGVSAILLFTKHAGPVTILTADTYAQAELVADGSLFAVPADVRAVAPPRLQCSGRVASQSQRSGSPEEANQQAGDADADPQSAADALIPLQPMLEKCSGSIL